MNGRHSLWRTDRPPSPKRLQLTQWVEQHTLQLLNEPNVDTMVYRGRGRPNTIDLAFSNIANATATIEDYLATGSLHHMLSIEALAAQPALKVIGRFKITTENAIRACGHRQSGPGLAKAPAGTRSAQQHRFRLMWQANESATGEETQRARVCFERTVRRSKRDFWREVIADITSPDDVSASRAGSNHANDSRRHISKWTTECTQPISTRHGR